MKIGDIVEIEGEKYMAHEATCGECDSRVWGMPCNREDRIQLNKLCTHWNIEKGECKIFLNKDKTPLKECKGPDCCTYCMSKAWEI